MRRPWTANLLIVGIGLAMFAVINARSGRVEANGGLGWDGRQYAHMVTGQLHDGTVATQTRPLVPLLTRVPHAMGLDLIHAFQLMNALSAGTLYFFLCRILDRHRVPADYKAYFVATVSLCIATSTMFAFYPVQIDLGALAIVTAASYIVMTRVGWMAGAAALLAVTSREFGVAVAIFGLHREVRSGRGLVRPLLTYSPAVGALFLLRWWASTTNLGDRDRPLVSGADFLSNLALWLDPAFATFFGYFTLTLLGGVTVLLALRPAWVVRTLAATPELLTFSLLIVAAAAVGNADIWRYLVFLLPVLTVLFGAYACEHQPRRVLLVGALALTVMTQQPFVRMDMSSYFSDWFPAYVYSTDDATDAFRAEWRSRLILTIIGLTVLGVMQWAQQRTAGGFDPSRRIAPAEQPFQN